MVGRELRSHYEEERETQVGRELGSQWEKYEREMLVEREMGSQWEEEKGWKMLVGRELRSQWEEE